MAQRLLIQPAERARTVCVCAQNPWLLILPTGSVKLHPSLDMQWFNIHTNTDTLFFLLPFSLSLPGIFVFYFCGGIWRSLHVDVEKGDLDELWICSWRLARTQASYVCACVWVSARRWYCADTVRKLVPLTSLNTSNILSARCCDWFMALLYKVGTSFEV